MSYPGYYDVPLAADAATVIAGTNTAKFVATAAANNSNCFKSTRASISTSAGTVDGGSRNVSSVSIDGTGLYTVTFSANYDNTNYRPIICARINPGTTVVRIANPRNRQVGTLEFIVTDGSATPVTTNCPRAVLTIEGILD